MSISQTDKRIDKHIKNYSKVYFGTSQYMIYSETRHYFER